MTQSIDTILKDIRACTLCKDALEHPPRPIVQMAKGAKILIAGQAPGRKVQESGIPFDDASGDRLRSWLGINQQTFYDPSQIAILPMGFCYPGTGKSGDLRPRPECAETWREKTLSALPSIELTIVIGTYALDYHIPDRPFNTLTETVKNWRDYGSDVIPLPHPSPRNNIWMKKNPWFETDVIPKLQRLVASLIS